MPFLEALTYPVRGNGWILIVTGAVFAGVLSLIGLAASRIGLAAAVFCGGYFSAFFLSIIRSTVFGEDAPPDWPSFTSFADDILAPYLRVLGLILVSFSPLLLVRLFGDASAPWYRPAMAIFLVTGFTYFPMAAMASTVADHLGGALPHIVLPSIFRTLPGYLGSVLVFAGGAGVVLGIQWVASGVPVLGALLSVGMGLYGLMAGARIIGLLYRTHHERLPWGEGTS